MDSSWDRVTTDGGGIVVADNEGELLETNDVGEESDDPYPLNATETRKSVAIIGAIYESAERGELVSPN